MANETKIGETVAVAMVAIKVWIGGPSAEVVELANAGKRGKTCRVLRLSAFVPYGGQPSQFALWIGWGDLAAMGAESFDAIEAKARSLANPADSREVVALSEIRGVDAPRATLSAGVEGVWSASATADGITVADLSDRNNDPRWITSGQSKGAAYEKAAKVWASLSECKTAGEAAILLGRAGCKLHGYCAVD